MLCISATYAVVRCPHHFSFFFSTKRWNVIAIFLQRPPNEGIECRWGRQNHDSRRISGYRMDDCWSAINNCDGRPWSLLHRPPRISESFITVSMDDHDEEKRTEQKSEAEVTNNIEEDCARRIVLLKLTTDRHEASRGLSDERVEIRHYNVRNVCNGRGVSVSICTLHT